MAFEVWKPIPGYEGLYSVSRNGQVKSDSRVIEVNTYRKSFKRPLKEKNLSPRVKDNNYLYVSLCKDGSVKNFYIHRLVLLAFVGNPKENYQACHKDGDVTNNNLENLRWDTVSENHRDKVGHKTTLRCEQGSNNKLSAEDVRKIKELLREGKHPQWRIGEMFGTTQSNISAIKRRVIWNHLETGEGWVVNGSI